MKSTIGKGLSLRIASIIRAIFGGDVDLHRMVQRMIFWVYLSPMGILGIVIMTLFPDRWYAGLFPVVVWLIGPFFIEALMERIAHAVPRLLYKGGKVVRDFSEQDTRVHLEAYESVRNEYRRMLAANPHDWEVRLKLAKLLEEAIQDRKAALEHWEMLCRPDPEIPDNVKSMGLQRRLDYYELIAPDARLALMIHREVLRLLPGSRMAVVAKERIEQIEGELRNRSGS